MSQTRIDEISLVPLGWVLAGFVSLLASSVTGAVVCAFWVSAVNFRLQRIEQRLDIPAYQTTDVGLTQNAYGSDSQRKDAHDDAKRLREPARNLQDHGRSQ